MCEINYTNISSLGVPDPWWYADIFSVIQEIFMRIFKLCNLFW